MKVSIKINGTVKNIEADMDERLVDTLRNRLHLTGTKKSCAAGECGVCTVIMDGAAVSSCLIYTWQAAGREIITIEGLSSSNEMNTLQKAFIKEGAIHCGYCTPGMIISVQASATGTKPDIESMRELIRGNQCSCTGYKQLFNAVSAVYGEADE